MVRSIKRFFRRVHNVYRWLPTIWKDQDWDDSYIVEILVKKLEHQRDFFLSDRAFSMNAHERAAEIQAAINGLLKTADSWEHYESPAIDKLNQRWGEGKWRFEPVEGKPNLTELHVDYPKIKTKEDKEQHTKEFRESIDSSFEQYRKDKREAYLYIADNIDKWWD